MINTVFINNKSDYFYKTFFLTERFNKVWYKNNKTVKL
ncbi:hypothetical protein ING2E5B_2351 [Fermentimonas caenicola]|jgi:hypothetical protein|uniref:Uncharacterized protein n=1 Tax=Fermentimonas caenicola TaxID=1562970 RepID=A0A098C3Q5_9BACT|nr:hypothetical protein ING2E5B_2351 [Fermentimonas caenicola]